jgi:hypothetical protein
LMSRMEPAPSAITRASNSQVEVLQQGGSALSSLQRVVGVRQPYAAGGSEPTTRLCSVVPIELLGTGWAERQGSVLVGLGLHHAGILISVEGPAYTRGRVRQTRHANSWVLQAHGLHPCGHLAGRTHVAGDERAAPAPGVD